VEGGDVRMITAGARMRAGRKEPGEPGLMPLSYPAGAMGRPLGRGGAAGALAPVPVWVTADALLNLIPDGQVPSGNGPSLSWGQESRRVPVIFGAGRPSALEEAHGGRRDAPDWRWQVEQLTGAALDAGVLSWVPDFLAPARGTAAVPGPGRGRGRGRGRGDGGPVSEIRDPADNPAGAKAPAPRPAAAEHGAGVTVRRQEQAAQPVDDPFRQDSGSRDSERQGSGSQYRGGQDRGGAGNEHQDVGRPDADTGREPAADCGDGGPGRGRDSQGGYGGASAGPEAARPGGRILRQEQAAQPVDDPFRPDPGSRDSGSRGGADQGPAGQRGLEGYGHAAPGVDAGTGNGAYPGQAGGQIALLRDLAGELSFQDFELILATARSELNRMYPEPVAEDTSAPQDSAPARTSGAVSLADVLATVENVRAQGDATASRVSALEAQVRDLRARLESSVAAGG
jgi:hypothetical protein